MPLLWVLAKAKCLSLFSMADEDLSMKIIDRQKRTFASVAMMAADHLAPGFQLQLASTSG